MIDKLFKRYLWLFLGCMFSFHSLMGQSKHQNKAVKREIIVGLHPDPLIVKGIERVKVKSADSPVDIIHSASYNPDAGKTYQASIILETYKNLPSNIQQKIPNQPKVKDAYTITTISSDPLIIIGSGYNARGTLYAAYKIANRIETGASLDHVDKLYRPKIDKRLVYLKYNVSGGIANVGPQSGRHRVNFTSKSLKQLPLYGVNGIVMTDHPIVPWFPFMVSDTLTYKIEPQATDLKAIFQDISQYGMDIYLAYPYFVMPDYTFKEIQQYLKGEKDILGFIDHYRNYHEKRLNALFRFFPEIDGLCLGGPEGTIGFINHIKSNGILKANQNDQRNLLILKNYLEVVQKVAKKYHKKMIFWTHNWGWTSIEMKEMMETLYQFPDVGILNDSQWSNMGWATLPILGYLSKDLKKDIGKYNDYYMMAFTDGEGLGGGVLPTCIPDALYKVGNKIIDLGFKGIVSRIDIHDKTNMGSLFNLNEINFIASMAPLWTPTPSLDSLWIKWAIRRFGKAAAPELLPVLKSSKEIILKGYMIAGFPLLYNSRFEPKSWLDGTSSTDFRRLNELLLKPGTPMLKEEDKKIISSGEYYSYQLNTKAVNIDSVRKDQKHALELCRQAIHSIKNLKQKLRPADYNYLLTTYNTAYYLFKGLRAATEVLYYYNITEDNFDNISNPRYQLKEALGNLKAIAENIRMQIGTDYFDQDYYYLPDYLVRYTQMVEKRRRL